MCRAAEAALLQGIQLLISAFFRKL